jgi:hypothetical protein
MNRITHAAFIALLGLGLLAGCGVGDSQTRLRTAIDAKNQELSQCYGAALGRDPATAGTMQAWIHVEDQQGRVDNVEFSGGDVNDPTLQSCMTDALTQVQLAEAPPANLKVEYTFQLTPQ